MSLARLACFAALGGFLFGYDLGLIGGALLGMSRDLGLGGMAESSIVGAFKLGAFFGAFFGGAAMLRYGRRKAIALNSVFTTLGPLLMAVSSNTAGLIVGRLVGGFGIGSCAIVVPAYLGEIAPVKHRGAMVQVYEFMLCLGMLAAMLADWALAGAGWRWMVAIPAIPSAVMALSLFVLPESPRWLVMRGQLDAALTTLGRMMGPGSVAAAENELLQVLSAVEKDKEAARERRQRQQRPAQSWANGQRDASNLPLGRQSQQQPLLLGQQSNSGGLGDRGVGSQPHPPSQLSVELTDARTKGWGVSSDRAAKVFVMASPDSSVGAGAGAPGEEEADDGDVKQRLLGDGQGVGPGFSEARCRRGTAGQGFQGSVERPWDGPGSGQQEEGQRLADAREDEPQTLAEAREAEPLLRRDWSSGGQADGSTGISGRQELDDVPGTERSFAHTLAAMLWDIALVARGDERRAFAIAMCLAFFDQANASTAIINFAPSLLEAAQQQRSTEGGDQRAMLLSTAVAVTKTVGVFTGLLLVDRLGRRPLLIWGAHGCAAAMTLTTLIAAFSASLGAAAATYLLLASMCLFILAFSVSWAGLYWVLVSEMFGMASKSAASAAATATLFLTGSLTNLVFMALVGTAGSYAFLVFAGVSACSGWFVWRWVPETKGRTVTEVQALLQLAGKSVA